MSLLKKGNSNPVTWVHINALVVTDNENNKVQVSDSCEIGHTDI